MEHLQFPVGKFQRPEATDAAQRKQWIDRIAETPRKVRDATRGFSEQQWDTPYRPGGWTARQVVHHVPDSHMNAYVRLKMALTEDEPTIKPYEEARWAELPDTKETPVEVSLSMLELLHDRWTRLMRALSDEQWQRTYRHPELGVMRLDQMLALYAWHSAHHTGHLENIRKATAS